MKSDNHRFYESVVRNALNLQWTAEVTNITIRPMQKS
jgi:hypothetical protein